MNPYPPIPEPPEVHTTELDWPERARADGWELSNGQWQHETGDESYVDDDWVYLGDGVWEDAYIASLPTDARRDLLGRYANALAQGKVVRCRIPEKGLGPVGGTDRDDRLVQFSVGAVS